jgi:hypothetical protein
LEVSGLEGAQVDVTPGQGKKSMMSGRAVVGCGGERERCPSQSLFEEKREGKEQDGGEGGDSRPRGRAAHEEAAVEALVANLSEEEEE